MYEINNNIIIAETGFSFKGHNPVWISYACYLKFNFFLLNSNIKMMGYCDWATVLFKQTVTFPIKRGNKTLFPQINVTERIR